MMDSQGNKELEEDLNLLEDKGFPSLLGLLSLEDTNIGASWSDGRRFHLAYAFIRSDAMANSFFQERLSRSEVGVFQVQLGVHILLGFLIKESYTTLSLYKRVGALCINGREQKIEFAPNGE